MFSAFQGCGRLCSGRNDLSRAEKGETRVRVSLFCGGEISMSGFEGSMIIFRVSMITYLIL